MAIYKFRVTFEEFDDVTRDIEIKPNQTFEELHKAIQNAINFDGTDKGVFFSSDDYWRKEDAIGKGDLSKIKLLSRIEDPHQKFVYEFGENGKWALYVELLKIMPDGDGNDYPKCVKTVGKAPAQYPKTSETAISDEDAKGLPVLSDVEIDDTAFYKDSDDVAEEVYVDEEETKQEGLVEEEEEASEEEEGFGAGEFSDNENQEEY